MTTYHTRTEINAQQERTRALVDSLISIFSLQPPDSPVHNVEPWLDGIRVPVQCGHEHMHVYALPWSRGWSIFTELAQNAYTRAWFKEDEATYTARPAIGVYSWRFAPARLRGLQRPIYCGRDQSDPSTVSPNTIAGAVLAVLDPIQRLHKLRVARETRRLEREHKQAEARSARKWYWR